MSNKLKRCAELLARILVIPAIICYRISAALMGKELVFPGWSQLLSLLPGLTGVYYRRAFYQKVISQCGDHAFISFGTLIYKPTIRIAPNVHVGFYCTLGDVTIEKDVLIGSHVSILNGRRQHGIDRTDEPIGRQQGEWLPITVGEGTWIGDRAVVMADVGKAAVIGAGAIVITPVPDYGVAVGVPAKVVRFRNAATVTVSVPQPKNDGKK